MKQIVCSFPKLTFFRILVHCAAWLVLKILYLFFYLIKEDLMTMSEVLTTATTTDPRVSSPQSDSAMGGSDTSQTQPNDR